MKSIERRAEFFKDISFLVVWGHKRGIQVMPIWFHRTSGQQADLYSRNTTEKTVTNCDGIEKISKHQKWEAVDFVVVENGKLIWDSPKYEILGKKWVSLGHKWGGNFKRPKGDVGHFQL